MMGKTKSCAGIDYARFVAALLIVAIHTSPLASLGGTGDFILTRIAARTAVPFFLMTSGFFLISRYSYDEEKLGAFVKKAALLYGAATLLYVPVNIYSGYFKMENLLPNMIKDVVFDGTFYHLWYLPASMIGAVIAWYLVKKLDYRGAILAAAVLYLIGLFGDSYYGIGAKIPGLFRFYELIFQVSDYTRNGIFFAPVFLILGGQIADGRRRVTLGKSVCGFAVSFGLMTAEALTLRHFHVQRHDSMYVFLLPCMYFLFQAILHSEGKRRRWLRDASLIIYVIHPMAIVLVRMSAKLLHLQSLLVENSIVYYAAVCLISVTAGVAAAILWEKCRPRRKKPSVDTDRAYIEIDLNSLAHNVRVLKEAMPPECELMAVVKAEAYGHGACEIAGYLCRSGVRAFAVATIDEGIRLRRYGIAGEILILGYTAPERAKELKKFRLTQTLIDYEYALRLNAQGYEVRAHIKVDTGMHRLGFDGEAVGKIAGAFAMKHIKVEGIFTHLCVSDSMREGDRRFTKMQIESFYMTLRSLKARGVEIPKIHIQSSYGLLNYPEIRCDYVRVGIALYGVLSSPGDRTRLRLDLRPVLSLRARVILMRRIGKGESVGYGRAFRAERDSVIAILPVGYADGLPRNLSCGKSYVLIGGHRAPIVGRICMDQLAVDVTDVPGVKTGMTATLIGRDGDEEIPASAVAEYAESITNELLSRMGRRLKIVVDE